MIFYANGSLAVTDQKAFATIHHGLSGLLPTIPMLNCSQVGPLRVVCIYVFRRILELMFILVGKELVHGVNAVFMELSGLIGLQFELFKVVR